MKSLHRTQPQSFWFKHSALAIIAGWLTAGLLGCSSSNENWSKQTIEPVTGSELKSPPSMIHEASLPEGFPAPGPENQIVIKTYPKHRSAIRNATKGQGSNQLFRPLFNHIKKNDIAMTAPVEMTYESGSNPTAMAFMYASPTLGKAGTDGTVEVVDHPARDYLSIGVRGGYSNDRFDQSLAKLTAWLNTQKQYTQDGSPRYLGYNSPFVAPFLKYGEVQIPVRKQP